MTVAAESAAIDAASPPKSARKDVAERSLKRLALALTLLPLVVSALVLIFRYGSSYHALSDNALNELRTRDVGRHAVLLGPYSRDGWNHPGPALYYLMKIPYLLSGSISIGLALGALLINGAAVVGMALIARRRGGTPLFLFTLVGCALVVHALGPAFMRDPWNPFVTVLPFSLFVLLTWTMTCGETWALPVGVAVASFCIQTHVGYAPLAIPLLVWGAGWLVVSARRARNDPSHLEGPDARSLMRAGVTAAIVLAVMWLPPVVEQLTHSPGNLGKIVTYFRHPPDAAHTLAEGYRVVASQFRPAPEWLMGAHKLNPFSGEPSSMVSTPFPLLFIPFAIAVFVLWRRKVSDGWRLGATVVAGLVLGVVAVARTIGPVYPYRLGFTWMLAMLAFVVVAWAGWTLISTHDYQRRFRWVSIAAVVALTILSGMSSVDAAREGLPQPQERRFVALLPHVRASLPRGDGAVIVRGTSFAASGYASGLVLALERDGVATRVDGNVDGQAYGSHRTYHGGPVRATLLVAADGDVDSLALRPDLRMIAYWGDSPIRQRLRLAPQVAQLKREYLAKKLDGGSFWRQSEVLGQQMGSAVAVFEQTTKDG